MRLAQSILDISKVIDPIKVGGLCCKREHHQHTLSSIVITSRWNKHSDYMQCLGVADHCIENLGIGRAHKQRTTVLNFRHHFALAHGVPDLENVRAVY